MSGDVQVTPLSKQYSRAVSVALTLIGDVILIGDVTPEHLASVEQPSGIQVVEGVVLGDVE